MAEKVFKVRYVTEKQLTEIQAIIDKQVAEFIDQLPRLIHSRLEGVVAQILGFESDSWPGGWRVDHCNGRMSTVGNFISKEANNIVEKITKDIGKDFKVSKQLQQAIRKDLREAIGYRTREIANSKAKEIADRITDQEVSIVVEQIQLPPTSKEAKKLPEISQVMAEKAMEGSFDQNNRKE